jgi:hypothetical protein
MIPSSRIAVLFECYGMMVGYLMARGVKSRLTIVTPQDWQRFIRDELNLKRGEMKHAEWKRTLSEYAKEKFKDTIGKVFKTELFGDAPGGARGGAGGGGGPANTAQQLMSNHPEARRQRMLARLQRKLAEKK